jgi:serine/threonine-protein kinase
MSSDDLSELIRRLRSDANALSLDRLVTELALDQRQRWASGQKLLAENYLQACPELSSDIERVVELIYREYLLREGLGDRPALEEYTRRFPQYTWLGFAPKLRP